jgi:hypothetical protein
MSSAETHRTYGNWHRPASGGLYGLGRSGTYLLFIGSAIIILLLMFSPTPIPAIIALLVLGTGLTALLYKPSHGRSIGQSIAGAYTFGRSKKTGENIHRSGPLTPDASYKLPGILRRTTVTEWTDRLNRVFAMISYNTGHHTVVLEAHPDGSTNMDISVIDQAVAHWGGWLAELSMVNGVEQATVTIETTPDTGRQLSTVIKEQQAPDAPPLSRAVMSKVAASYPESSAVVRTFATVTFNEKSRVTGKLTKAAARREAVARSIADELPSLCGKLLSTGAGPTEPLDVQQLCEVVYTAYDPAMGPLVEHAAINGEVSQVLSWDNIGPAATHEEKDYYEHDSAFSHTTIMTVPPRQAVPSSVLDRLLAPAKGVARKRVTIIYRPLSVDKAAVAAEKGHTAAQFNLNSATKKTAVLKKAAALAERAAEDQANGAGLTDFAVVITTTVMDRKDLPTAKLVARTLATSSQLRVRPAYWMQAAAFAVGLPLGFIPENHITKPTAPKVTVKET